MLWILGRVTIGLRGMDASRPFRRLVQDYEGYASTLADLHLAALTCHMLK